MEIKKTGNNAVSLGLTGSTVQANVARYRDVRKMSYAALEAATHAAGRRVPAISIRRIEEGTRRVDVDDLFALCVALEVPPVSLLSPNGEGEQFGTAVPEHITSTEFDAWLRGNLGDFSTRSRLIFWEQTSGELNDELTELEEESSRWADRAVSSGKTLDKKAADLKQREHLAAQTAADAAIEHIKLLRMMLESER